jgi:uncharacterized membrane protein (DUF106 family)
MAFENFILIVAVAAIFYALLARVIQAKMINKEAMKAVQEESKRLSAAFKEANEAGNKARADAIMKEQMELFPKMNKVMFSQFKPMIVIIGMLMLFSFAISTFDPTDDDDIVVNLMDNGLDCDEIASDGVYSSCYEITGDNYGKWIVFARAMQDEAELGKNYTYFLYNIENTSDTFVESATGEQFSIETDKTVYYQYDKIKLTSSAPTKADRVEVKLSNGTNFFVDLPFTIPILNVQRIQQPYWWFIFVAMIGGIIMSIAYSQLQKAGILK